MKTIQETVEIIIKRTPFIEEAMQEKLINVSSLARVIQPEVEQILGKNVKAGAIMMSINRISPVNILRIRKKQRKIFYCLHRSSGRRKFNYGQDCERKYSFFF